MPKTISPADMKRLETEYMTQTGMPGALLMEHAAQGVCTAISHYVDKNARALFLCGPGNNGGDGYAAARLWQAQGGHAVIWELSSDAKGDAALNRRLALDAGIPVVTISDPPAALPFCHIIVDALFGTGLTRAPEGIAAQLIRLANASDLPIVAVDIPSGLDGSTGRALGETIRATETVTFHRIKDGLLLRQGPDCTGKITVHPILIPEGWSNAPGMSYIDAPSVPTLPATAHKGTAGRVVILAGSPGMAGAAAFCARAALSCGAGLVELLCRENILHTLQCLVPGATCKVLPEDPAAAALMAETSLATANAAVIGPGLGQDPSLLPLLDVFRQSNCPVVWDADALNLLAQHINLLPLPPHHAATPHPGEAARLLHTTAHQITEEPLEALQALHERLGCHVLLKGARSLMTDGNAIAINPIGSPRMAQGGSGDKLCGVMAALLARRLPMTTLEVMQQAALIHQLDFQPERVPHIP